MRSAPTPLPPSRPDDLDVATASRKGGPIQRFARGGIPAKPTMKFYGGGASNTTPAPTPAAPTTAAPAASGGTPIDAQYPTYTLTPKTNTNPIQGNALAADQFMTGLPGMTPVDLNNPLPFYYTSYGPGQGGVGGQTLISDWSQMTPDQKTQYSQMVAGTWQPPAPAAPAATPPPAAPAPAPVQPTVTTTTAPVADNMVADPSLTAGTGAPEGVPNAIQAKSYDPNVDVGTGATFKNTTNTGGTNYTVGTDDTLQTTSLGVISGSRKGGPIRRYAQGGAIPTRPTLRFAAGGASPNPSNITPSTWQEPAGDTQSRAAAWDTSSAYVGPTVTGGWAGSTPFSALAPNQQTWATQYGAQLNSGQLSPSIMPDAVWPTPATPAPAAPIAQPAPTIITNTQTPPAPTPDPPQPTITPPAVTPPAVTPPVVTPPAVTPPVVTPPKPLDKPAPNVTIKNDNPSTPLYKTPHSLDPNDTAGGNTGGVGEGDWANTGGTNYAVGSNNFQAQNTPVQIAGFRRGGIPANPTLRVRYDDGGGVSPSALGPPPALAGGQNPIPPYYFNPATYAPAGAPVGKGVTMTSAPTYVAGAIPSLPMMKGGVVRYADGGDVDPGDSGPSMSSVGDDEGYDYQGDRIDQQIASDEAGAAAKPSDGGGGFSGYINPEAITHEQPTQPQQPTPTSNQPPPGAPPWMGQGKDDQGNPSRGFIAALSGGIQWIAQHLGLAGGAQQNGAIAQDPNTQTNRHNYVTAGLGMTSDQHKQMTDKYAGLDEGMRNILALEEGWKFLQSQGRDQDANKFAASVVNYSVRLSQDYGDQAVERYMKNDIHGAVDALNKAEKASPDGRNIWAEISPDGKSIIAHGSNLNGEELWRRDVAPEAIWAAAKGFKDGTAQYASIEDMAAKYDPAMKALADEKRQQRVWDHQQDVIDQRTTARQAAIDKKAADAAAAESAASAKFTPGGEPIPVSTQPAPPTAPTTPPPALTPVSSPESAAVPPALPGPPTAPGGAPTIQAKAEPGRPLDSTGSATPLQRPPDADQVGVAPRGPTGHGGALPTTPGADIASAQAQPVNDEVGFRQIADSLNQKANDDRKKAETDAEKLYPIKPFYPRSMVTNPAEEKAWVAANRNINEENSRIQDMRDKYIAATQKSISDQLSADMENQREVYRTKAAGKLAANQETAATKRSDREIEARKTAAGTQQQAERDKEALINYYKNSNPLDSTALHKLTNPDQYGGKIEDRPDVRMARGLGIRIDDNGNINSDDMKKVFPDGPDEWVMAHHVLNSAIAYTTHGASPSDLAATVSGIIQRKYALEPTQINTPAGPQTLLTVRDSKGTPFIQLVLPPNDMRTLIDLKGRSMERYAKMTTEQKAAADAQAKSGELISKGTDASVNRPVVTPPGGGLGGTAAPTQQVPGVATPASKPFFGRPSYDTQPGDPGLPPKPEDPYAPTAPPAGVGEGFRVW